MDYENFHSFEVSIEEAIKIQIELGKKIELVDKIKENQVKLIAGCDVAYDKSKDLTYAAVIVFDYQTGKIKEEVYAHSPSFFPYVPGLLAFREAPALLSAFKKLTVNPDVFIFDGQGIAHPRRMGIATHLGILLNKPTIGCAKSKLYGEYELPENKKGAYTLLYAPGLNKKWERVGAVLRSKENTKPIFISCGNLITLNTALKVVKKSLTHYRLPFPCRVAHQKVTQYKNKGFILFLNLL